MTDEEVPEPIQFVSSPNKAIRQHNTILNLRVGGYTYEQIAEVLAVPGGVDEVKTICEKGAAQALKNDPKAISILRDLTHRRLEMLLKAVMPKALDPENEEQMAAQARALAIIDRHAKMYGLDSATKIDIEVTPTMREMNEFIEAIMAERGDIPEEGDIFSITSLPQEGEETA